MQRMPLPAPAIPTTRRLLMTKIDQDAARARIRLLIAEKADGKQQVFADLTGLNSSILSKMLRGREVINRKHLQKIEQAPGVKARLIWLEQGVEPVYYEGELPQQPITEYWDGPRLREFLEEKHIEHSELARRLNRSKNTIQGYFKSETINSAIKDSIAEALGVSNEEIFGDKNLLLYGNRRYNSDAREVKAAIDSVEVARLSAGARVNFNPDALNLIKKNSSVEVPREWLRDGKTHIVIDVDADILPPLGGSVLAYQADADEWPYLDRFVAIEFRNQLIVRLVTDNDLLSGGVLTLTSGGSSPTTLRVPRSEIRSLWKVIHNMGGPM